MVSCRCGLSLYPSSYVFHPTPAFTLTIHWVWWGTLSLPPTQPKFRTPWPKHTTPHPAPSITPISCGSASMLPWWEENSDWIKKFKCKDYNTFICEDLSNQVLFNFKVFMKHVLHIPSDWRDRWKPVIQVVREDAGFKEHHKNYCLLCNKPGLMENELCPPLMRTVNAVLRVLSQSNINNTTSRIPQYCHHNNPKKLWGDKPIKSLSQPCHPPQGLLTFWNV